MNQPDYTLATADILTAATLAKPEAKKAAVKAVLEAYFPATGERTEKIRVSLPSGATDEEANIVLFVTGKDVAVFKNRWGQQGQWLPTSQLLDFFAEYYPATGEPVLPHTKMAEGTTIYIHPSGRAEMWEGHTYHASFNTGQDALAELATRKLE